MEPNALLATPRALRGVFFGRRDNPSGGEILAVGGGYYVSAGSSPGVKDY